MKFKNNVHTKVIITKNNHLDNFGMYKKYLHFKKKKKKSANRHLYNKTRVKCFNRTQISMSNIDALVEQQVLVLMQRVLLGNFNARGVLPARLTRGSSLATQGLGQFLESFLQLQRKLLVTLFTNRLHVELNKLVPAKKRQTRSILCL